MTQLHLGVESALYNSTACTGKLLQAHFDHIDRLFDHILGSLKEDSADIPLKQTKEQLLRIVDEEYKKLAPVANSHLVSAGLAQQNTLKGCERSINDKKEKVKQAIETKLALFEEKKATSEKYSNEKEEVLEAKAPPLLQYLLWLKRHGLRHWKLILLAVCICGVLKYGLHNKILNLFTNRPLSSSGRTQLYSRTQKRVEDAYETIKAEKLNPWILIATGKMQPVTQHNGKVISYRGLESFEGSPRLVFWSDDFIPPFIEEAIVQVFDETIEECREAGFVESKPYIDEANSLLRALIWKIYNHMADIDRKLSGKRDSKKAARRDISLHTERMERFLKGHYDAALLLASKNESAN